MFSSWEEVAGELGGESFSSGFKSIARSGNLQGLM